MSMCHRLFLIATAMITLAGANVTANDTESFGVDSYIPQKFTDLEWRLDGYFRFDGDRSDRIGPYVWEPDYDSYHASDDDDTRNIRLNSFLKYEHITIPKYLKASLEVSGRGTGSSDEWNEIGEGEQGSTERHFRTGNESQYGLLIHPSVEAGQYLLADLFVSSSLDYYYSYNGQPDDQDRSFDTTITVGPFDTVWSTRSEYHSTLARESKSHNVQAEIAAGWGRIYDGRYAATALNMVGEIRDAGLVEREPSSKEMLELTELVYQYREQHAIDRRLHRIEALDAVISYLHERGMIADAGPYGHLLVEDVWDYFGVEQSRSFGWTVSGGVSYHYNRRNNKEDEDVTRYAFGTRHHPTSPGVVDTLSTSDTTYHKRANYSDVEKSPALVGRVRYSRPLSLKWQLDVSLGGRIYFDAYESSRRAGTTNSTDYSNYYAHYFQARVEYIYDLRTSFALEAKYDHPSYGGRAIDMLSGDAVSDFKTLWKEDSWNVGIGATFTYRISVPTSLSCSLAWAKNRLNYTSVSRWDNSSYWLSVSISHWLM